MSALVLISERDVPCLTPVRFPAPAGTPGDVSLVLVGEKGVCLPAQRDGSDVVALVGPLAGGTERRFELIAAAPAGAAVAVWELEDRRLEMRLRGEVCAAYHYSSHHARPFLHPVLGPGGLPVTRSYPLAQVAGETNDHPHHRSLWTAYGAVNGVDDWSEAAGQHGFIRHRRFLEVQSGAVFGGFTAELLWTAPDGEPVLSERRTIRLYNTEPERRLLDYEVTFIASHGDVHFGDTKEGGIVAVRVATSMDAKRGGRIENEVGGVGEAQCWGKRAAWCDYSGPVPSRQVGMGIAVMDHPRNFRHPTHWHVRDYGLMAANVFGAATFERDSGRRGEHVLKNGEELMFRYRLLVHRGNATDGRVSDAYHAYAQPPKVRT
ncbi:MAG: PmoA family protein [Armatimonadetes bacterium]|nr:PmoA family protein [Armatimonadota bacterium]